MSIVLDGSNGLTTPGVVNTAGETIATTLAVTGATNLSALTTTGNTILGDASTDTLNVGNGGLVKDASGNVLVGTTSATYGGQLTVRGAGTTVASFMNSNFVAATSGTQLNINVGATTGNTNFQMQVNSGGGLAYNDLCLQPSGGNLLVGVTSAISSGSTIFNSGVARQVLTLKGDDSGSYTQGIWSATATGDNLFIYFGTETSLSVRGAITYNRAGGLTVYGTTSDYRAKTVNGLVENALAKVALLKPSTGRMNGATENIDFFVAHELQEVVPSAVTGEKDATKEEEYEVSPAIPSVLDEEGNEVTSAVEAVMGTRTVPVYQMVDKSALIPLLTAAIQEQQSLITQLQADVAALKALSA